VIIKQNSRKLLMMDILMSETCWAHKKWNKITSDIKLFFHSSTILWLFQFLLWGWSNIFIMVSPYYVASHGLVGPFIPWWIWYFLDFFVLGLNCCSWFLVFLRCLAFRQSKFCWDCCNVIPSVAVICCQLMTGWYASCFVKRWRTLDVFCMVVL